jgi:hypothetical protein
MLLELVSRLMGRFHPDPDPEPVSDPKGIFSDILNMNITFVFPSRL